MLKNLKLAIALTTALALPALAEGPDAATVVAKVGDVEITLGNMIVARSTLPAQYLTLPDDVLFTVILDQLIQQAAVAAVGEQNVTLRDELVLQNERRAYLAGAVLDSTAEVALTDAALQAAYDERFASAEPGTEYNAAHILLETEEAAIELKAKLDAGGDFTELAKANSTGPSGPNGGELGWFSAGMMVKEFEDAVLTLEVGQVSDPVQTQFGWHIIKLSETRIAEAPTLDAMREELTAEVQNKAVVDRLAEITGATSVEKLADGIDPAIIKDVTLLDK